MAANPSGTSAPPRAATDARSDELLELVGLVRRELVRRGESLGPGWVDQAVVDLRTGDLSGWYYPPSSDGPGLAFYSSRPSRAYGHVHLESGPNSTGRAVALVNAMVDHLPIPITRMDVGITGVPPSDEAPLQAALSRIPGGSVMRRWALDRGIGAGDAPEPERPGGMRHLAVRAIPLESLDALDRAAFLGTPDESLVADTPEENRRVIAELLEGRLGLFLDAASTLLVTAEDHLVGAILTAEESPHRAIFLDIMVAPSHRRQGLATYLVRWGLRALFALGYDSVTLWVSEANTPARDLYDRLGFTARLSSMIFRYRRSEVAPQPQSVR